MKLSYNEFLEHNRYNRDNDIKVSIVGVDFKKDTVTCINASWERIRVPITILVLNMEDDLCHINDASKLRKWSKWGTELDYPDDYFDDPDKYVTYLKQGEQTMNDVTKKDVENAVIRYIEDEIDACRLPESALSNDAFIDEMIDNAFDIINDEEDIDWGVAKAYEWGTTNFHEYEMFMDVIDALPASQKKDKDYANQVYSEYSDLIDDYDKKNTTHNQKCLKTAFSNVKTA